MNRPPFSLRCRSILGALTFVLGAASTSWGGVIFTPGSIPAPPTTTLPAVHGTPLASGGSVEEQYGGPGITFLGGGITEINGVKVWTPAGDYSTLFGSSLYYGPNATIYGGFNVPGDTDTPLKVGSVQIELIGVPVGEALVGGFDQFVNLITLTGNNNENLVGPNGGILAILEAEDLSAFAVTYPAVGVESDLQEPTAPWGIASVEIGEIVTMNDPPVNEAPEPGTLLLAGLGAAGLFGYRWRRQRG